LGSGVDSVTAMSMDRLRRYSPYWRRKTKSA
jgi:hypothetical protein